MKIVLDTNVLVSATIVRNGRPFQLLKSGELADWRLYRGLIEAGIEIF